MTYRKRPSRSVTNQLAELSMAVPQVVMQRLSLMMLAGPNPSARDLREMNMMWTEKMIAFHESWSAMTFEALRANQQLSRCLFDSFWSCSPFNLLNAPAHTDYLQRTASNILGKGLAPVHRRAVANAKRLGNH
ncbi:MAG: hypothetical protein KDJ38_00435 [Gammaproteobacteria bacterium]|nr:hypothetical protein [Gammaproteobacteria bacterium]